MRTGGQHVLHRRQLLGNKTGNLAHGASLDDNGQIEAAAHQIHALHLMVRIDLTGNFIKAHTLLRTSEYVRQRAEAESSMSGNKETDRPLNTLIDKEVRDEKAVNSAIRRLYEGQYVITHKSVEEQEREERAVLEGIGEPAQQFAEREEDEILDGDRNADDAVLDDDVAPEDGEAAETDSGDAADAVTEDETAADAVAEEKVEAAEAAEAEAVEESDADGSAGTSEN
mgnify:CR=1 FL=1